MYPTKPTISILERLSLLGIFLQLPFRVLPLLLLSPFLKRFKKKRVNRVFIEAATRFTIGNASIRQLQWASTSSVDTYKSWAKGKGIPPVVEELEGNAKLIWLTEKRTDRVLVYVHGGGFALPATMNMYSFCARIREELLQRDDANDFGIVVPVYSLLPAKFPTQLNQLTIALTHILSSGVKQENVILLGDSAGGNLIMQLMVHTLHPFEGVAVSPLSRVSESNETSSLGGICLVSPWLSLDTWTPSFVKNNDLDVLAGRSLLYWGKSYLSDVPESHHSWIKPVLCAPVPQEPWKWLAALDEYVGRVLITAGGKENLLDDSLGLYDALKDIPNSHLDLELDVEEEGIHEDPIFDVALPQKNGGGLSGATMKIINWVGQSFGSVGM